MVQPSKIGRTRATGRITGLQVHGRRRGEHTIEIDGNRVVAAAEDGLVRRHVSRGRSQSPVMETATQGQAHCRASTSRALLSHR